MTLFVPVKFINENNCPGIKQGGVLNVVRREIELITLVSKIPESLEANLDGLEIGDSIHISSINLQEGVKPVISDRDFTIATIAPPTVMKVEEEKPVEEAEESTLRVLKQKMVQMKLNRKQQKNNLLKRKNQKITQKNNVF